MIQIIQFLIHYFPHHPIKVNAALFALMKEEEIDVLVDIGFFQQFQ